MNGTSMSSLNNGQSIAIYVIDATQANELMRTSGSQITFPNGNIQTPNVSQKISENNENPKTKQMINAFMPTLNYITDGKAGQINKFIGKTTRIAQTFATGGVVLGSVLVAAELTNQIVQIVKNEIAKAEKENRSNLLKIRSGDIQIAPGGYTNKTNMFGKIKYNTN